MSVFEDNNSIKYPRCKNMGEEERLLNINSFLKAFLSQDGFDGFARFDYKYTKTKGPNTGKCGLLGTCLSSEQYTGRNSFYFQNNAPADWSKELYEAGSFPLILANSMRDEYAATNLMNHRTWHRRKKDFGWCAGISLDFDNHRDDIDTEPLISMAIIRFFEVIEERGYIRPTVITHTARGIQPLYRFKEPLPVDMFDVIKEVWRQISDIWRDVFKESTYNGEELVVVDSSVGDLPRVIRVPGTYNTKGKGFTYILECSGKKYTLEEICESYSIDLEGIKRTAEYKRELSLIKEQRKKERAKNKAENKKSGKKGSSKKEKKIKKKSNKDNKEQQSKSESYLSRLKKLRELIESGKLDFREFGPARFVKLDLLSVLDKLYDIRSDMTGCREIYTHIYYNLLIPVYGKRKADKLIYDIYDKLCEKSSDEDVFGEDELQHILDTFYEGVDDITIYNYMKFETVREMLHITDDEIELIGKGKYVARYKAKEKASRKNAIRSKARYLCRLYRTQNYTQEEVADMVNEEMGLPIEGDGWICKVSYVRRYAANIDGNTDPDTINYGDTLAYLHRDEHKIVRKKGQEVRNILTRSAMMMIDDGDDGLLKRDTASEKNQIQEENTYIQANQPHNIDIIPITAPLYNRGSGTTEDVMEEVRKGNCVTAIGPGGTGKSTIIHDIEAYCNEKGLTYTKIAYTGIASEHISGKTLYKALNIGCEEGKIFSPDENVTFENIAHIKDIDVIIVDECSFIRADAGLFLIKAIRDAEEYKGIKKQVIWLGDFLQLPPVASENDKSVLKRMGYPSYWLFKLPEWKEISGRIITLTKNFRTTDKDYLDVINRVRTAENSPSDLSWLEANCDGKENDNSIYIA